MDKLLRPERLAIDPESQTATIEWNHWYRTFQNFILTYQVSDADRLRILINHVSPAIYEYIIECKTFNDAISVLKSIFLKPVNEVFSRYKLANRKQQAGETITRYLESLKLLSKECGFKAVTAELNRDEYIRDAFIAGLFESTIRQRLLESYNLTLNDAFSQARSMESALEQSQHYRGSAAVNALSCNRPNKCKSSAPCSHNSKEVDEDTDSSGEIVAAAQRKCYFCGLSYHKRSNCPAKEATCRACSKVGHYSKVCKSSGRAKVTKPCKCNTIVSANIALPSGLSKATTAVLLNDSKVHALVDTGSSASFISERVARKLKVPIKTGKGMTVTMASTSFSSAIKGIVKVDLKLNEHEYCDVALNVLPDLCSDVILGHDILGRHSSIEIQFGGSKEPLTICSLSLAKVPPVRLFRNLSPNHTPIATKSRRHSASDAKFIELEIEKLLKDDIIEESFSPWRAQVLVTQTENHKRRMVIDYSQTINRYTELDAYPLPRIQDIVNKVANYEVFSSIDLRSAYQ